MDPNNTLGFLQSFIGGGGMQQGNDPRMRGMMDAFAVFGILEALAKARVVMKEQALGGSPMGPGQLPPMGRMAQGQPQGGMPPGVGPSMGG